MHCRCGRVNGPVAAYASTTLLGHRNGSRIENHVSLLCAFELIYRASWLERAVRLLWDQLWSMCIYNAEAPQPPPWEDTCFKARKELVAVRCFEKKKISLAERHVLSICSPAHREFVIPGVRSIPMGDVPWKPDWTGRNRSKKIQSRYVQ